MSHLLYEIETVPGGKIDQPPPGYRWEVFRPSLLRVHPSGTPRYFAVWWLMHHARVFRNRDFHVVMMKHGDKVVHYSLVSPDYYRFPFMADRDLTVGDSWTDPAHRGKGLYTYVLKRVAAKFHRPGRKIWTIHAEGNEGSRKSFTRAGYQYVGDVERTKRFGLRLLGQYRRPR